MIMIITLTLTFLVALNFFLLFFSCNKTTKKEVSDKTQALETIIAKKPISVTKQLPSAQLAPTGS